MSNEAKEAPNGCAKNLHSSASDNKQAQYYIQESHGILDVIIIQQFSLLRKLF